MMIYEVDSVLASFQIRNLRIREIKYIAQTITLYVENLTTPIRWNWTQVKAQVLNNILMDFS